MNRSDIKIIKQNIIKCLTEPDENGNIFMAKNRDFCHPEELCTYDNVFLTDLMDYIVKGLYMSLYK